MAPQFWIEHSALWFEICKERDSVRLATHVVTIPAELSAMFATQAMTRRTLPLAENFNRVSSLAPTNVAFPVRHPSGRFVARKATG